MINNAKVPMHRLSETDLRAIAERPDCAECPEQWSEYTFHGETRRFRKACKHDHERQEAQQHVENRELWRKQQIQNAIDFLATVPPPKVYDKTRLADVDKRACSVEGLAAATRYLATWPERREKGEGLLFAGDIGTGKTMLAAAISNELAARAARVMFLTVTDLQNRLRDFDTAKEFLAKIKSADLLVLDDFGQEKATEWSACQLFDVIDDRCQGLRPILLTTNLSAKGLTEHYIRCLTSGKDQMSVQQAHVTVDRILSRLRQRCVTVRFAGADQRAVERRDWLGGDA